MRPKRHLGQNFLVNRGIVTKLLTVLAPTPDDYIIEIGPGPGALTHALVDSGAHLTAVDLDREMIERLREEFAGAPRLSLVHHDIVTFELPPLPPGRRYKVIGNIPYNISSPILFWLADRRDAIDFAILTMQREVAARLCATPGTKAYGPLTLGVRAVAEPERLFDIRPHSFWPPPRVHSSSVRIRFPNPPPVPPELLAPLRNLVRRVFTKRRKMLRGSLATELLAAAAIDPTRRPETLSLDEFVRLVRVVVAPEK